MPVLIVTTNFLSFLALSNAFRSVSHLYILYHIQLPTELATYITNSYTHLAGSVKTKRWSTPNFKIQHGVFQGDTLITPYLSVAFNPLIELCNTLLSCGFSLKLPVPDLSGLPSVNTAIYIERIKASSDVEPAGWYNESTSQWPSQNQVCRPCF